VGGVQGLLEFQLAPDEALVTQSVDALVITSRRVHCLDLPGYLRCFPSLGCSLPGGHLFKCL
jgi:hypothetical protein